MGFLLIATIIGGLVSYALWKQLKYYQQDSFIESYEWPRGLLQKLEAHYPSFTRKESALVGNGLRQFFRAYLRSGRLYVAMPSQCADELWHEFILYTRDYEEFCKKAFGGFLHHTPAVVLAPERKQSNEGLRRVWWHCCKMEAIDPKNATRLPLLFALDRKFNIPGGYIYAPDCRELRRNGEAGTQCGGDFHSSGIDGGTDGFGGDGADGGGGDGGGCGGGD
jgi:hypothetical protein